MTFRKRLAAVRRHETSGPLLRSNRETRTVVTAWGQAQNVTDSCGLQGKLASLSEPRA
jgi:hypothetical protein